MQHLLKLHAWVHSQTLSGQHFSFVQRHGQRKPWVRLGFWMTLWAESQGMGQICTVTLGEKVEVRLCLGSLQQIRLREELLGP